MVPQFIEDFFFHMTSLSLREIVQQFAQKESITKRFRKVPTRSYYLEHQDSRYQVRSYNYSKLKKYFAKPLLKGLKQSFHLLSA